MRRRYQVVEECKYESMLRYDSPMTDPIRFKDFSLSPEPVRFAIDGDTFACVPEIPLDALGDLAKLGSAASASPDEMMSKMHDLFDGLLLDESAALFRDRCASKVNPIGMRHVMNIIPWLLEVYGMRPIEPSSESGSGSNDDADSSTDTAFSTE